MKNHVCDFQGKGPYLKKNHHVGSGDAKDIFVLGRILFGGETPNILICCVALSRKLAFGGIKTEATCCLCLVCDGGFTIHRKKGHPNYDYNTLLK